MASTGAFDFCPLFFYGICPPLYRKKRPMSLSNGRTHLHTIQKAFSNSTLVRHGVIRRRPPPSSTVRNHRVQDAKTGRIGTLSTAPFFRIDHFVEFPVVLFFIPDESFT